MYQPPAHKRQSTDPSAGSVNLSGMTSTPERPPRPESLRRGSKAPLSSYKNPPARPTQSNKRSGPSAPSTPKEHSRNAGHATVPKNQEYSGDPYYAYWDEWIAAGRPAY
jgi:hypothetical protein